MASEIGKNVAKPLELGVSYFQNKATCWYFLVLGFLMFFSSFMFVWMSASTGWIGIEDKELNSESMQAWNKLS